LSSSLNSLRAEGSRVSGHCGARAGGKKTKKKKEVLTGLENRREVERTREGKREKKRR
jgi:hypothetical protein